MLIIIYLFNFFFFLNFYEIFVLNKLQFYNNFFRFCFREIKKNL